MCGIEINVYEIDQKLLDAYSKVPISFQVDSVYKLRPTNSGLDGVEVVEVLVDSYVKGYDTDGDNPSHLLEKFDMANWRIIVARVYDQIVAGAIIAHDTDGINMLEGKSDLAVLWDIRVKPEYRGRKLGTRIMDEAKKWATNKTCNRLKIETQNTNVKACRFYAKQGAELTGYNRHYYYDHPDEIQFIWSIYLR